MKFNFFFSGKHFIKIMVIYSTISWWQRGSDSEMLCYRKDKWSPYQPRELSLTDSYHKGDLISNWMIEPPGQFMIDQSARKLCQGQVFGRHVTETCMCLIKNLAAGRAQDLLNEIACERWQARSGSNFTGDRFNSKGKNYDVFKHIP